MRTANILAAAACCLLLAAGPTSKPAPGPDTSISNDLFHFPAPPEEWTAVSPDPMSDAIFYLNKTRDGEIHMEVLPKGASVDSGVAMNVAVAVVKRLKQMHEANHDVVVMQPKILKDDRFAFMVHEKYKVSGHVMDRLHVYKSVGPRMLLLTADSLSEDDDRIASIQSAGKDLIDSVKLNRKAFKKDN